MNSPKLRFKGYTSEWTPTILSKKISEIKRKAPIGSSAPVMMIAAANGFIEQSQRYSADNAGSSLANYTLLKEGELAYNHGFSNIRHYGSCFDLRVPEARVPFVYHAFSVGDGNPRFFGHYLNCGLFDKQLRTMVASTARMDGLLNISFETYSGLKINLPSDDEQREIAVFFDNLNATLSNKEDYIESLKSLKLCYLSRLFPIGGGYEPSIRLKGFTGPWKRQKLEDLLTIREDTAGENYTKENVLSVSGDYGVVNQIEFQGRSFAGASISNYRVVNKGNVVYTKSPLKASPYGIIKTAKKEEGIVSPLYAVYDAKENCDPDFVQTYFENKDRLNLYLRPLVNKGAKNTLLISDEGALQGEVVFPEKDEQKAITEFFTQLDGLIRLHEEELEKLKSLKQSCLEGMFV